MATSLVAAVALGGSVSGCVSTQHKNTRAKLVADRTIDGRRPLRIAGRSRDVRVISAQLVRGRRSGAVVVELRNAGTRAVTDIPIAVGVQDRDGRRVRLNAGSGLAWFQTHVPAIGAGETTTWVLARRRPPPSGRAWAVVGRAIAVPTVPLVAASVEPARGSPIATRARGRRADGPRAVRVALLNRSDVPQYGLQVYALARAGGRVVAAGVASVRHLGSRGRAGARVALVGTPGRHTVRVHTLATIFE